MKIICKPVNNMELLKTQNNKYYLDERNGMSFSDNVMKQIKGKEATISYYGYSPMTKFEKYDDSITITLFGTDCEVNG